MKMASPLAAASAYANIARLTTDPSRALAGMPGAAAASGENSFASLLKDAIGSVVETGKKSDAQTQAMVSGKSNMVDVVTAVAETQVAVDAVVAVRDKVIAAYDEIMKMPI
jgi:flagellar hook-basal body complex protein FliE